MLLFFFSVFLLLNSCTSNKVPIKSSKNPKNVIFIIADGMGPATVTATRIWAKGSGGSLNMEKFPVTGYAKTYSASDFVTDSAASGTALASGVKTYNKSIGLSYAKIDPAKKSRPLQNIVDVMKDNGYAVGLVSTARTTHATPASFFAHIKNRNLENEIAEQVKVSNLDLLMGGGRRHFLPQGSSYKGKRKDGRNLINELEGNGWSMIQNKSQMNSFSDPSKKKRIVGLFSNTHMTYERIKRNNKKNTEPTFTEMVEFAVDFLSDRGKGFFLMAEAGRIDHASHDSLVRDMLEETLELDNCVGRLLKHPKLKDTLIVITADHETGGYAASGYGDVLKTRGEEFLKSKTTEDGRRYNHSSWATGPGEKGEKHHSDVAFKIYAANHTAVDVPVLANGPGSEIFGGYQNNTELPKKILSLFGLKFTAKANLENPDRIKH